MVSAARQPLGGWRNEACLILITVPGADLSGRVIRAQVRLSAGSPGAALLDLEPTTDPVALGVRFVGVSYAAGFPTTSLMVQVPQASMQGLPYFGEVGQPAVLAYGLQIDGKTRMFGDFFVLDSAIDSDNAPANRPTSYGSDASSGGWLGSGVTLTLGGDGVTVAFDGSAELARTLARAESFAAKQLSGIRFTPFAYLGPVATLCTIPDGLFSTPASNGGTTFPGINTKQAHFATEPLTQVKLAFLNRYVSATDYGAGGPGTLTESSSGCMDLNINVSIEYPAGKYTPVTFAGARPGVLLKGALVYSDWANVNIPEGAEFWVDVYWSSLAGGITSVPGTYNIGGGARFAEGANYSAVPGGDGDLSMGPGSPSQGFAPWRAGPQAILGMTTRRTYALIGDSRTVGTQDGVMNSQFGDTGEIARCVRTFGYLNMGVGNDRADKFLASNTYRLELASHCSDIVIGYGVNDFFSGGTDAPTHLANVQKIRALFPGKQAYLYTLPPAGIVSNDNYKTLTGQVASSPAGSARRIAYNNLLRAGVPSFAKIWEVADVLESSRDSDKWRVDRGLINGGGAVSPGGDPTHENAVGNQLIADSGAVVLVPWAMAA